MNGHRNKDRYVEEWRWIPFVGEVCRMVLKQPTHPQTNKQIVPVSSRPRRSKRRYRRIRSKR